MPLLAQVRLQQLSSWMCKCACTLSHQLWLGCSEWQTPAQLHAFVTASTHHKLYIYKQALPRAPTYHRTEHRGGGRSCEQSNSGKA